MPLFILTSLIQTASVYMGTLLHFSIDQLAAQPATFQGIAWLLVAVFMVTTLQGHCGCSLPAYVVVFGPQNPMLRLLLS